MQAWEYKVLHRVRQIRAGRIDAWDEPIVAQLPALGEEGWELITVITRSSEPGGLSAGVTTDEMWVFKRPRTNLSPEATVVVAQAEAEPEPEAEDINAMARIEAAERAG